MIKRRTLLTSALAASGLAGLGGLAGCGQAGSPDTPSPTGPAPRPAVSGFAARLMGELLEPGRNHAHSPISILLALGLLRSGASGRTADQLDEAIAASGLDDWQGWAHDTIGALRSRSGTFTVGDAKQRVNLTIADALFAAQGLQLKPDYVTRLKQVHDAGVQEVDFSRPDEAAATINRWAAEHTDGQIDQILDPSQLSAATVLVLANALHLAANWARELAIDAEPTTPFHREDGSSVQVRMMHQTTHGWYTDQHVDAALLGIAGDQLAMALALPKSPDWSATLQGWAAGGLEAMLAGFDTEQPVTLSLPPWTMDWSQSLNDALKALGLDAMFSAETDLSGITAANPSVDQVVHRAVMAVDQFGVVASAVTAITTVTSAPVDMEELTLDRPFAFVIFDRPTRIPLFIGRLSDPQE